MPITWRSQGFTMCRLPKRKADHVALSKHLNEVRQFANDRSALERMDTGATVRREMTQGVARFTDARSGLLPGRIANPGRRCVIPSSPRRSQPSRSTYEMAPTRVDAVGDRFRAVDYRVCCVGHYSIRRNDGGQPQYRVTFREEGACNSAITKTCPEGHYALAFIFGPPMALISGISVPISSNWTPTESPSQMRSLDQTLCLGIQP